MSDTKGYVYVLSNESMPGIVKIGRSKHGGQGRADALYKNDTAVPTPFKLEYEVEVNDSVAVEDAVHKYLEDSRVNEKREFFNCSVEGAGHCIQMFLGVKRKPKELQSPSIPDRDGGIKSSSTNAIIITHAEIGRLLRASSEARECFLSVLLTGQANPDDIVKQELDDAGFVTDDGRLKTRCTFVDVLRVFGGGSR